MVYLEKRNANLALGEKNKWLQEVLEYLEQEQI